MSAGKGDTREAKEAYRVYNQKRNAYAECNKNVTRVGWRRSTNGARHEVIYNTAEGGENFLDNEKGNGASCQALYRAYVSDYNQLVREIADQSVSHRRLIETLHNYRDHLRQYRRCSGAKGGKKNPLGSLPSEGTTQRCGAEYTHYRESYEELSQGLMRLDDLSLLRARQRFLRNKKVYEECLRHPRREIRRNAPARKVARKRKNGLHSHDDIAYTGAPVNNVLIALRARSQSEPDDSTVTDAIPDGKTPFYLFIYYKGARPSDRLEVLWYLKKPGQKEQLLFDETNGRFPTSEGVIRGGPILAEGGAFSGR
jgi:hypothetical protein